MPPACGLILAGGRSARMGRDKASIEQGGETWLARTARVVGAACEPVVVVAAHQGLATSPPPGAIVVPDPRPFEGPLAGVLVGLDAIATRAPEAARCFVVGVDSPRLTTELVRAFLARARDDEAAVLAEADGLVPLPAVVPVARARVTATALRAAGASCLRALVEALEPIRLTRAALLEDAALRAIDPALAGLRDADDEAELAAILGDQ